MGKGVSSDTPFLMVNNVIIVLLVLMANEETQKLKPKDCF
jgi:hypothetical protein